MIYSANYGLKEPQKNVDLADVNDINYNTEAIDGIMHNTQISLAPAYDQTLTYEVGDLVMYETLLYECITAVTTPEAWDSTKWQRAYLSENAGGGGNANVTEITYNQYSLLTPAEKANGTIYMVTNDPNDSNSGGGGGGGVNYSTTEQNTGLKWIDGKDIYQKTYSEITCPNNSTVTVASLSSLNVDKVIDAKGFAESSVSGGNFRTLPFCGGGTNDIRIDVSNFDLRIVTYADWSSYKATITIYYTKSPSSL